MPKPFRKFKLFGEIWSIGKCSMISTGRWHSVIKNNGKEYHVYDNEALFLRIGQAFEERADIEKTKLYIITKILDKNNWKFNLQEIPKEGSKLKVIYEGFTVNWIDFIDCWENCKLPYQDKIMFCYNPQWQYNKKESQFIWEDVIKFKNIIAWRYETEIL